MGYIKKILQTLQQKFEELTWFGKVLWIWLGILGIICIPEMIFIGSNILFGSKLPESDSPPVVIGTIAYFGCLAFIVFLFWGIRKYKIYKDENK